MILVKFFWANHLFLWVKEQMSNFLRKNERFAHLLIYHELPERNAHSWSFVLSDLSNSLTVALLTWATWVIGSQSLICPERSEWVAHSRSFDLSNLSEWAISEWANSQCLGTRLQLINFQSRKNIPYGIRVNAWVLGCSWHIFNQEQTYRMLLGLLLGY